MLSILTKETANAWIARRPGEVKFGEKVHWVSRLEDIAESPAPFVLLGICEDIGIRANLGRGGAQQAWPYALRALLNIQENRFNRGGDLCILGHLEFPDFYQSENYETSELREMCARLDEEVAEILQHIFQCGKIPLIIGGGHNNAYPIIKAYASARQSALNVLNIDPHTDYRQSEGRHSGNGFRYAREAGYLQRYLVYGLHQNYNSETILSEFAEQAELQYVSFESLLARDLTERDREFKNALNWLGEGAMGLEIDMDSISNFPVSALNPSGFHLNEIRQMIYTTAILKGPVYLHLPEASPGRASSENEKELMGKALSYLISDFIKAHPL